MDIRLSMQMDQARVMLYPEWTYQRSTSVYVYEVQDICYHFSTRSLTDHHSWFVAETLQRVQSRTKRNVFNSKYQDNSPDEDRIADASAAGLSTVRSLSIADDGYERAAENVGTSPLKAQVLVSLLSFVFLL